MTIHLHLLGGAGRIGRALTESLIIHPIPDLSRIRIYCDSTKVADLTREYTAATKIEILVSGYSAFNRDTFAGMPGLAKNPSLRQVVINLRGVNNKQQWLNQPLDALEVHTDSCRRLIDSNLWMQSNIEIIHLSSQLCDLIESPRCLDDICEGQESYRRPYMVSRLHQEMLLSANAYQHTLPTSFLRLPAVYGFEDDCRSPWVLNSLCKAKRHHQALTPRNPSRSVYLAHRLTLLACLRSMVAAAGNGRDSRTVNYLRPPMLRLSVAALASMVEWAPSNIDTSRMESLDISLEGDTDLFPSTVETHLQLLLSAIEELLTND